MKTIRLTLSLLLLLVSLSVSIGQGELTVFLKIDNHQLVVDSSVFKKNDIPFSDRAEMELVNFLNQTFKEFDKGVRESKISKPVAGCPLYFEGDSILIKSYNLLTSIDTSGDAALRNYFTKAARNPALITIKNLTRVLQEKFFPALKCYFWDGSPITINTDNLRIRPGRGFFFTFQVFAPIDLDNFSLVYAEKDTLSKRKTKRILKGLDQSLWFENRIKSALEQHYFLLNTVLDYEIFEDNRVVDVRPKRLATVQVLTDSIQNKDEIFYWMLPTKLFQAYREALKEEDPKILKNIDGRYIFNLLNLNAKKGLPAPILETDRVQITQMQLNKLQFNGKIAPTSESSILTNDDFDSSLFLDFIAIPIKSTPPNDTIVKTAAPKPNEDGVMGSDAHFQQNNEFGNSRSDTLKSRVNKVHKNYIGAEFAYNIDDAASITGIYQRLMKDGSTFSFQGGYAFNESGVLEGDFFGTGSYFKDFIFFKALKKRVSMQLTANSLFTNNRVIDAQELKERRQSGKVKFNVEWFRNLSNQLLQTNLTQELQQVKLTDTAGVQTASTTLSFTELGWLYFYSKSDTPFSTLFKLEPVTTFGFNGVNSENPADFYWMAKVNLVFNQSLSGGFAFNFVGNYGYASDKTPIFDQSAILPNLNRGFKEDDVIGRKFIGLQPEFWLPFPFSKGKWGTVNQYIAKHFRLAAFLDCSYFEDTTIDKNGWWLSPGVGIRFINFPVQVNLDWAYGMAPPEIPDRKSRFSLNLVVNTPF